VVRMTKRLTLVAKALPLMAIVAVVVVLVLFSGGRQHQVEAHTPHPGLDFSIGVNSDGNTGTGDQRPKSSVGTPVPRGDDCVSFSVQGITATPVAPPKCTFALNGNFTVNIYMNSLGGVAGYQGIGIALNFANLTSQLNGSMSSWPNCAIPVSFSSVGFQSLGCSIGVGAPASTYTGLIGTLGFTCSPTNNFGTITMVFGSGSTVLVESSSLKHTEGSGTTETLTITCGTPPTLTATETQTRTPTNTPTITPTPTITRTPTVTPTVTNTPTSTPLPSDQPDVTLTKTDSPDPVDANGTLTYSLLVKNLGLLTATGVLVGDALPSGTVFISANSSGAGCGYNIPNNLVLCALNNPLPLNGQVKIVIQVTAPSPAQDTRISNVAQVSAANEPFFNTGNNSDIEETVVLAPRADLTLIKVDEQDPVDSGGTIVYDLTVNNIGQEKATNVVVKENLPPGTTFLPGSSSPACTVPNGAPLADSDVGLLDVQCDVGASFVGQTVLQVAVTAPQVHRDTVIKNLAFVTGGNELFSQTGNNLAVQFTAVLAPPPDVAMDKSGPAMVRRTERFDYTLTVSNLGFGDAFNVGLSDQLPSHTMDSGPQPMTLESVDGATCPTPVGNLFSCTLAKLPGNTQVVITLHVRAPTTLDQLVLPNTATATDPTEPGDPSGNNSDTVNTKIDACFDVNGDGIVRIDDVFDVIQHYFASPPSPNYDLVYDFDGDGIITISDIYFVLSHYFVDCL
jgi:uncharacterized repeat protein (TIGR01451 family)